MGSSNSQPIKQHYDSNYMSSDQVKATIRDLFRLSQGANYSATETIGFKETENQTGGKVFMSRINRYDSVLKQLGGNLSSENLNMTLSSTDKYREMSPRLEDLQLLRNILAKNNQQTGGANTSAGSEMLSATSDNPINYAVLRMKGGNPETHDNDKEHSENHSSESEEDKKKKKNDKKDNTSEKSESSENSENSEVEDNIDLEEDDDVDFEDSNENSEQLSRVMDDSDESSSDTSASSMSSSSSSSQSSSSSSDVPRHNDKMKRRSAYVESASSVKAVPFYSSESASAHLRRLKRKNRF